MWSDFRKLIKEMRQHDDRAEIERCWNDIKGFIKNDMPIIPAQTKKLIEILKTIPKEKEQIKILDHGCGGGTSLLFLAALGYKNVWGVDIAQRSELLKKTNLLVSMATEDTGEMTNRVEVYDGSKLPFPDDSFDLIYSQQVLEHVRDDVFNSYYQEEARVLRKGGIAYHQVPHRLVPYESHTRTWFIHWLPWKVALRIYGLLGLDVENINKSIHLRWPSLHWNNANKYIGKTNEISIDRLSLFVNSGEFEGFPGIIRRVVVNTANIFKKVKFINRTLSKFIMSETISVKS